MTTASIKRDLPLARRIPDQQFPLLGEPHRTLGLKEIFELVRRRLGLVTLVIVLGTALSVLVAYYAPKTYKASSMVVLERTDTRPFAPEADLKSLERDRSAADTELDVLTSRMFLGRVVDSLDLINNPDFNTYLGNNVKPGSADASSKASDSYLSSLLDKVKSFFQSTPAPLPSAAKQRDRAITNVLSRVAVARTGESLAVTVTVSHGDPDLAAAVANSIANLYVEASLEFKRDDRVADSARAVATGGAVAFLRERVTQPLLITLRGEEARLLRERAEFAATFGKNHPKIQNADAEIVSVRRMIGEEIQRILLDLENEAAKPSARVVSLAEVPTSPFFPKPTLVIAGGFVGSSVLAALLITLLEIADTRIRDGEQIRRTLRVPNLASVPHIPAREGTRNPNIPDYLMRRPQSPYAEAMRSLYVACRVPGTDRLHKVIAFTSCLPGEGASSSALGLALSAVADGQRTLILDLDLHECEVMEAFKLQLNGVSLDRYLRGECSVSELLQKIPNLNGLSIIGSSNRPKAPGNLLNSNRFRELFEAVRPHYDVIVVDTPPILSVDDVNWISPLADAVILVVSWGKTKEEILAKGAARLRMTQAPLLGTILNNVATRKKRRNGDMIAAA